MKEDCWYKEVCVRKDCASCIRYAEMKYLMDNSGIPKRRQLPERLQAGKYDRDAFEQLAGIKDDIVQFVENGENLYIMGENTGNGKTSWSIKLMLKYFDCVWAGNGFNVRGYFQHIPALLTILKDFSTSHTALKSMLETVDLVIWDDIAATKLSDYDISQLLLLIDKRELDGKANIYTGNIVDKKSLSDMLGGRLASRVWNSNTTIIHIKGSDRR